MRLTLSALCVLLSLHATAWAKDVSFRQRVLTAGLPEYQETAFFVRDKGGRDGERLRIIVDVKAKTMTVANKLDKTSSVTPLEGLRRDAGDVTLKATGKTEKIMDHEAREYTVEGGGLTGSVWLAEGFDVPADVREWALRAGALSAKVPAATLPEAMVKAKGLPLRSVITVPMNEAKLEVKTEVIKIEDTVPADLLSVPADFKPTTVDKPAAKK